MTRTNLSRADLRDAHFGDISISSGVDFNLAQASHLTASKCNLPYSTWMGTTLSGAHLDNVQLTRGRFKPEFDAMESLNLVGVNLDHAVIEGADLSGILMDEVSLKHSRMRGAVIRDAHMSGATFKYADCRGVAFSRSDASKCDFSGANLERAQFTHADITDANFNSARVEATDYKDAIGISTADFRAINGAPIGLPSGVTLG